MKWIRLNQNSMGLEKNGLKWIRCAWIKIGLDQGKLD